METSKQIGQTYQLIKNALVDKLGKQGYVIVEEREDDRIYGSRFAIWSNNEDMLRFTWDGKEKVFLIETTNEMPISPMTSWTVLNITPYSINALTHESIYTLADSVVHGIDNPI
jgi:hypothetical protein